MHGAHPRARAKRCRDDGKPEEAATSPLTSLIAALKQSRLPTVEAAHANALLGDYVKEALKADNGSLLRLLTQFSWSEGHGGFVSRVDLFALQTSLSKFRYERLVELGSGSYAVVYKARNRETDEVIALKKLRFGFDQQGLPSSTLREISLLRELKHPNIVELKDIIYGFGTSNVYVVLECLDCDLRDLMDRQGRNQDVGQIKLYMWQILQAIHHAHCNCVMHRDLKPQNILVDQKSNNLKVADFGLARSFLPPFKAYTDKVVTLWYRAPELLLGAPHYSAAIDMWSVGCIFAELLNHEPLFRAESEIGQLHKIFQLLGTPTFAEWPGLAQAQHFRDSFPKWRRHPWAELAPRAAQDAQALDLLAGLLAYDPNKRLTASAALQHPWLAEVRQQQKPAAAPTATQATASGSGAAAAAPAAAVASVAAAPAPAARPAAGGGAVAAPSSGRPPLQHMGGKPPLQPANRCSALAAGSTTRF